MAFFFLLKLVLTKARRIPPLDHRVPLQSVKMHPPLVLDTTLCVCMTVCLYDCVFVWLCVCMAVCLYGRVFV